MHGVLRERGVVIAERTVTNLLDRYDELMATSLADDDRLRAALVGQGRVILALDGLQPDVGHEVLWSCASACRARSCLPEACCPRRARTWPRCCARSRRRLVCQSPA